MLLSICPLICARLGGRALGDHAVARGGEHQRVAGFAVRGHERARGFGQAVLDLADLQRALPEGDDAIRNKVMGTGEALAWLTWAGASGGAHGRRRGNALGRDAAWWTIAALTGQTSHWPLTNDAFETATDSLQWFWWDANDPTTGWNVRLCVHHAERNRSWAFALTDMA